MSLFSLAENLTLKKIEKKDFSNEAELHALIEKNLPYLMGIRLIGSEYPIPNGRIDTLGLDEDDVPVIIEYKWKKDLSAIVQGLFYLDWVMQNRKPFESIVKDKLGKETKVDWSIQPRLIIVAQEFDIKELSAINHMGPSVELKKYSYYEGLFNIEDVNIVKEKRSKSTPEHPEATKYTIEYHLKKTSPGIAETFSNLRDKVLGISDGVWEKIAPYGIDYRTSSTFTAIQVQKARLKIFIKMGDRQINDPRGLTKPVPTSYGFGYLNTWFELCKFEDIDYSMELIMQAYDYVSA